MKLTPKLIEILKLMNSGWQLGLSKSCTGGWWLQKGGCGYGGESKRFHGNVKIFELVKENLIKSDGYGFPTQTYHLTEKGKGFLNEK